MPSILSKILMPEWNVPYNCYELGHTWTPYCSEAALEIGLIVFNQSLKLYTPLYLGQQVIQKKFSAKNFEESIRSILRSSIFLGMNSFLVILFFCLSRQVLGRMYYTLCAYVPSFFGSLFAILNERPSRQRALAFYVANIASETLFRILVSRGYIRTIPHGDYLMFTMAVTILIYLYEMDLLQDPLIKFVFRLILGSKTNSENMSATKRTPKSYQIGRHLSSLWDTLKFQIPFLNWRHPQCSHRDFSSCFEEIVLKSFLKSFSLGLLSQLAYRTGTKLMAGRLNKALQQLKPNEILSKNNITFSLFLSLFTTIYKTGRCITCYITNEEDKQKWKILLSAVLASPAMFFAPRTSLALYLFWKSLEALFNLAIKKNSLKGYDKLFIALLYASAASQLFYAMILDPSHMKPSYKKFIDDVTLNRLKNINRNVLDVFGTNASKGYESFTPVYDLKYTTKRFQESVLVWLL